MCLMLCRFGFFQSTGKMDETKAFLKVPPGKAEMQGVNNTEHRLWTWEEYKSQGHMKHVQESFPDRIVATQDRTYDAFIHSIFGAAEAMKGYPLPDWIGRVRGTPGSIRNRCMSTQIFESHFFGYVAASPLLKDCAFRHLQTLRRYGHMKIWAQTPWIKFHGWLDVSYVPLHFPSGKMKTHECE